MSRVTFGIIITLVVCFNAACSTWKPAPETERFLASGTIILSRQVPDLNIDIADGRKHMAPLLGYLPPKEGFVPSINEAWLEINSAKGILTLYTGSEPVKELRAQGEIKLERGSYVLQHKQVNPLWYAPSEYFVQRGLSVPPEASNIRYRRGALGSHVLYPSGDFAIHSSPVWCADVGGLRVDSSELATLYGLLPVGAPIEVK